MNQLFQVSDNAIHIDNLIIEGLSCKRQCPGCYFHAHRLQPTEYPARWAIGELFAIFFDSNADRYSANQISISVNEPTGYADISFIDNILISNYAIRNYMDVSSPEDTKVHLTMYSPKTIDEYKEGKLPLYMWSSVDSIYFSNIDEDDIDMIQALRRENKNLEIGWNCWQNSPTRVADIGLIDSIYWIRDKSKPSIEPLFSPARAGLNQYEDVCGIDYDNWKHDWHNTTCSANISKFSIWPDGSVSGCPYAKTSNTGPADTVAGIIRNIVDASKNYDFDRCPMKEIYDG